MHNIIITYCETSRLLIEVGGGPKLERPAHSQEQKQVCGRFQRALSERDSVGVALAEPVAHEAVFVQVDEARAADLLQREMVMSEMSRTWMV